MRNYLLILKKGVGNSCNRFFSVSFVKGTKKIIILIKWNINASQKAIPLNINLINIKIKLKKIKERRENGFQTVV